MSTLEIQNAVVDDLSAALDHFGETALRIKAERDEAVAVQDTLRDQLSDAHQRIFDLQRTLSDMQDNAEEYRDLLHDLVQDECEKRAIGGGPGWQERHEKSWTRAFEIFERCSSTMPIRFSPMTTTNNAERETL